jgi:hypothetical protein
MSAGSSLAVVLAVSAGLAGSVQAAVMGKFGWTRLLGIALLAAGAALTLRK